MTVRPAFAELDSFTIFFIAFLDSSGLYDIPAGKMIFENLGLGDADVSLAEPFTDAAIGCLISFPVCYAMFRSQRYQTLSEGLNVVG
jgi:hypothetical protein